MRKFKNKEMGKKSEYILQNEKYKVNVILKNDEYC